MTIRPEETADAEAVAAVHDAAFGRAVEGRIVAALRRGARPLVSLVAAVDGAVVGHVVCSPVAIDGRTHPLAMGLGPVGVLPAHQRRGVGAALVGAAVERCRDLGASVVVVLGDPAYYGRVGFVPAAPLGLTYPHPGAEAHFQARVLRAPRPGVVRYHPAFDAA